MTTERRIRVAPGGGATMTEQVHEVMVAHPGRSWTAHELVDQLDGLDSRQVQNVLTRGVSMGRYSSSGRESGGLARYTYPPAGLAGVGVAADVSTPDELRPIVEAIPDDAYKAAGLQPVATAADGARICVDDQGTAWKVRVIVEARLV